MNYLWKPGSNHAIFLTPDSQVDPLTPDMKNFLPFQHKNDVFVIATIEPHRIYQLDVSSGLMEFKFSTSTEHIIRSAITEELGISAGPIQIDDDRYLVAAHSRVSTRRETFFYS